MVFECIIRYRPRRRPSPCLAEGFSPTASAAERMNFSKTIRRGNHPSVLMFTLALIPARRTGSWLSRVIRTV